MFSNQNCDPDEEMMLETKLWLLLTICTLKIFTGQTLTCHRTEYQIGNECCPMCGIGTRVKTDCEADKSTSCQPCAEGTFMNKLNGLKNCFPCSNCVAGSGLRIKRRCTKTSDTVCEPLEGFFCTEPVEDGCAEAKKHTICKAGYFASQNGSSVSDTVCSPCSAGSFSDGTFSSCRPHTKCGDLPLLRPGTESADAQCGRHNSDRTAVIVGVCVVVSLFLSLSAAVGWYYRKKIGKYLLPVKNREAEKNRGTEKNKGAEENEVVALAQTA